MDLEGKRCLVLGLAREGVSLARYLVAEGAEVTVTDRAPASDLAARVRSLRDVPVRVVLGGEYPDLVGENDYLFTSPGIPESNAVYRAAMTRGVPVESMTTLFFQRCPGRIVGITGSSGKTTTTGLIGHILMTAGVDTVVGGNIGAPMIDLLPHIEARTTVVLELSSFQLQLVRRSPQVAVVTNISPNHLDRHGTMEKYIEAKRAIVRYQRAEDVAVLNADDPVVTGFAQATPAPVVSFSLRDVPERGAALQEECLGTVCAGVFHPVLPRQDVPLLGMHNIANVLAALATCRVLGVDSSVMAGAVRTFRPAMHRLETVAVKDGVTYINDSIATSPARAQVALDAVEAPILLIAGGRDKNLPWDDVARRIAQKTRALFLVGEAAEMIRAAVEPHLGGGRSVLDAHDIRLCATLAEAVHAAADSARPGDVVLLSPGCTSYDMFTDFEERGREFSRAVGEIRGRH